MTARPWAAPYTVLMTSTSAEPFTLPRTLIFLAPLWLIGSWILSIGLRQPIHPSTATYTPAVQMMLQCVLVGLIVAWPLYRLSQAPARHPIRQTVVDVLALAVLVQFVVWPLRIFTVWPVVRVLAIDLAMLGWLALAGAVVAAAIGTARPGPRHLAMLVCATMPVLGPTLAWVLLLLGMQAPGLMQLSPMVHVGSIGEGAGGVVRSSHWAMVTLVFLAAAGAWIGLAVSYVAKMNDAGTGGRAAEGASARWSGEPAADLSGAPSGGPSEGASGERDSRGA